MLTESIKWLALAIAVMTLYIAMLMFLPLLPAAAHEAPLGWQYDGGCCSTTDCREVPNSAISEKPDGYHINATGEVIPYNDARVRESKDQYFHWCSAGGLETSNTICIYRPPRGF